MFHLLLQLDELTVDLGLLCFIDLVIVIMSNVSLPLLGPLVHCQVIQNYIIVLPSLVGRLVNTLASVLIAYLSAHFT